MINRLFFDHPASVDESYLQHLTFATGFAAMLLAAAIAAMAHALIPALFEKTASGIIARLYHKTHNRGAVASD